MLKNTVINIKATIKIAKALGELNHQVVFVGGAMVSLYIDDPAAEDIRPTKDIDLTFQIATVGQLEDLRQSLTDKGFHETHDSNVICRFSFEDLLVDVMSTKSVGWAPSNRWFASGFDQATKVHLEEIDVRILPFSYFLASKMDAFFDRGIIDVYASHDMEDIIYLFNYRSGIVEDILVADKEVKNYLVDCVNKILNNGQIMNALPGHLYFEQVDERMEIIMNKMKAMTNGLL